MQGPIDIAEYELSIKAVNQEFQYLPSNESTFYNLCKQMSKYRLVIYGYICDIHIVQFLYNIQAKIPQILSQYYTDNSVKNKLLQNINLFRDDRTYLLFYVLFLFTKPRKSITRTWNRFFILLLLAAFCFHIMSDSLIIFHFLIIATGYRISKRKLGSFERCSVFSFVIVYNVTLIFVSIWQSKEIIHSR